MSSIRTHSLYWLLPFFAVVTLTASKSFAATHTVCSSGCDFVTVQAAHNAASASDTIDLLDPVHTEQAIVVSKDINLLSSLPNGAILQANALPDTATDRVMFIFAGNAVSINDLTIRHGKFTINCGGGIFNLGSLTLRRVTVTNNISSVCAGGIFSGAGSTFDIFNSTFTENTSFNKGGAINSEGDTYIVGSTFNKNSVSLDGGAIYNTGSGSLQVINSTFSENIGPNGGAGIFNDSSNSTVAVSESTFSDHRLRAIQNNGGSFTVRNTILANSLTATGSPGGNDCAVFLGASITDLGSNIVEKPFTCSTFSSANQSQIGVDPYLGVLANNAGPTQTYAISYGSPAFDSADGSNVIAVDQRLLDRMQYTHNDVGAFELQEDIDGDAVDAITELSAARSKAFRPTTITTSDRAVSVVAADIDGDGDQDVLSASGADDKIAWYENDGDGNFSLPASSTIAASADGATEVFAADLDGDGDQDVLSASQFDNQITWYENDGSGNFSLPTSSTITSNALSAQSVIAADLDGDGDKDVLSASRSDNKIAWYENDGSGNFSLPASSTISTSAFGAESVFTADLDGDGDLDVLSASQISDTIAWYKNDGSGNFSLPASSTITTNTDGARAVFAADLDGDGDQDVLSASQNDNKVAWYENDGNGNFSLPATSTITSNAFAAFSVFAADMDGDGDQDVLSASQGDSKVAWYENDGNGSFSLPATSTFSTNSFAASSVFAADMDGDGDQDVLAASPVADNKIVLYRNPATNPNDSDTDDDGLQDGEEQSVIRNAAPVASMITTNANVPTAVFAADLDGDGDQDVLSASLGDDKIAWYENDGNGNFSLPVASTITTNADGASSVFAADLDGDGDQDVLSASFGDNKIAWYENDGDGNFSLPVTSTITTNAIFAYRVFAADLDGDGDQDVLSASSSDSKIAWYENDGDGNFSLPVTSTITTNAAGAISVFATDLDGDGDQDVLSASQFDNKIAWYENDGNGNFSLPVTSTITTNAIGALDVFATDLDDDGDQDVLSASPQDDKIAWYENDGNGSFSLPATSTITTNADTASSVFTIDLDGDGDQDVLSASTTDNKIAWYENDGNGSFSLPTTSTITSNAASARSVFAADLDGDGDQDVLSALIGGNEIEWYENLGTDPQDADTDNDGADDASDAFPSDPSEQIDTDGDGTGDNADTDDDNDSLLDTEEDINGNGIQDPGETDSKNADSDGDTFNDDVEITAGSDPLDPFSTPENVGENIPMPLWSLFALCFGLLTLAVRALSVPSVKR